MHDAISVRTPAKINLSLDIIGKRQDGYHFVRSIMQAITIFDEMTVTPNGLGEIRITCSNEDIPCDHRNLAYKAAIAFFKYVECEPNGIDINIEKTIPALAGLAGGSSNAAGAIVALNALMETGLSIDELCNIGNNVGADIPFCISGGTSLAEGVGDILSPLPNIPECYIVVVKPNVDINTAEAFQKYDLIDNMKTSELNDIIASIVVQDLEKTASLLFNSFEFATDYDEIADLKKKMLDMGAMGALMTGSGSAVYGIFEKKKQATRCADEISENYSFVKVCTPHHGGVEIIN